MNVDSPIVANPFAVLTLIAAPAVLTNAASVLAMSTSNRFLRASERMRNLAARLNEREEANDVRQLLIRQVGRVEQQSIFLLHGLAAAYVALASFASGSLISIVGAALASVAANALFHVAAVLGLGAGFVGAGGLVVGCFNLFRATRLSMLNIMEEAALIRTRLPEREKKVGELSIRPADPQPLR